MSPRARLIATGVAGTLSAFAIGFVLRFPWRETARAVYGARLGLLTAALATNLLALLAKGLAWHLIIRRSVRHRLRSALVATFIGAAVNCLSVSLGGEATRIELLSRLDGVGYAAGATGVVASRLVEALALAGFVGMAAAILPGDQLSAPVRAGIWSVLILGLLAWRLQWLPRVAGRGRPALRRRLELFWSAWTGAGLVLPLLLGLVNWLAEWATYHLSVQAVGVPVTAAASLEALIISNIAGIPRLTPANLGVLQTGVVLALLPVGVAVPQALAAGLVLQAVQTLPVLLIASALGAGALRAALSGTELA